MKKEVAGALLALLFIVVAGLRLTIALSEPTLTYQGYHELRLLENLKETGTPFTQDPLSFGGRERAYSPLFHYLLLPFTFLLPAVLVLKILPNILFASVILFVYFIAFEITKHRTASLLASFLAAFTPIIFSNFINDANPHSLSIPLFIIALYALLRPKKRIVLLLIAASLLSITSTLSFLLVAGVSIFIILCKIEDIKSNDTYPEFLLFLTFFGLWTSLLIYKSAFFDKGFSALWSYTPSMDATTQVLTLPVAVGVIGVLPLFFACWASYTTLFDRRSRPALLCIGTSIATVIGMLVQLLDFITGMVILTLLLCALCAQGFTQLFSYLKKTRVPQIKFGIISLICLFFLLSSLLPAFTQGIGQAENVPGSEQVRAAQWMHDLPASAYILAAPTSGFFLEQEAQQRVFIDEEFLLIPNAQERVSDAQSIYRSRFAVPALELLEKHGITHILVSQTEREWYGQELLYFLPHNCIRTVYGQDSLSIHEVICSVSRN